VLAVADAALHERVRQIEQMANVRIERGASHIWGSQENRAGLELAAVTADALGLDHGVVHTLAGHDSTNMKDVVPMIMLFVPNIEGSAQRARADP